MSDSDTSVNALALLTAHANPCTQLWEYCSGQDGHHLFVTFHGANIPVKEDSKQASQNPALD